MKKEKTEPTTQPAKPCKPSSLKIRQLSKISEPELIAILYEVARKVAPKFTFGYFKLDDIIQEAVIIGIEGLPRYDEERPIKNFLYIHMRNRLDNLMRNKFFRDECPCNLCRNCEEGQTKHTDGYFCDKFKKWLELNCTKASLMSPLGLLRLNANEERHVESERCPLTYKEIIALLTDNFPTLLRADYLKLQDGLTIPDDRRELVADETRKILARFNISESDLF